MDDDDGVETIRLGSCRCHEDEDNVPVGVPVAVPVPASIPAQQTLEIQCNGVTSTNGHLATEDFAVKLHHHLHEISDFTVKDIPANEKVASIDHILEQVFQTMEIQDLLRYRLVSPRWRSLVRVELQKRISLIFYNYCNLSSGKNLIQTSSSLLSLNTILIDADHFPCNKFTFISHGNKSTMMNLKDGILQDFLSIQGFFVEELSLRFKDDPKYLLSENDLMELIKTLLIHQAPNLRFLSLRLPSKIEWEINHDSDSKRKNGDNNSPREGRSPLRRSDPEYTAIISEVNKIPITNKNTKLRVLKLQSGFVPSAKILELIIQLAPNLDKIIVDPLNYGYFLEPFNRLHLLKNVWLNPNNGGLEKFLYEEISLAGSGTGTGTGNGNMNLLQLRHITLNLNRYAEWSVPYANRVTGVINRFFASSWNSLETVRWNGVVFLLGMELPEIMPKVWKLGLSNIYNLPGQDLFPPGFNLTERFPKLKSVDLFYLGEDCDYFLKCLCFKPVLTVRNVQVSWQPVSEDNLKRIYELFPNAQNVDVYESE